jgi:hypothetical protein
VTESFQFLPQENSSDRHESESNVENFIDRENPRLHRVRLSKSTHVKKFKGFGPACNSEESKFKSEDEIKTIEKYFQDRHNITLAFPFLPSVECRGYRNSTIRIPPELIVVPPGQLRAPIDSIMKVQLPY